MPHGDIAVGPERREQQACNLDLRVLGRSEQPAAPRSQHLHGALIYEIIEDLSTPGRVKPVLRTSCVEL
jgi:hypothetical protein